MPVCDLVIIPGTKATIADLAFVRAQGWDIDLVAHHRRGGRVLGLCGGYQMLGVSVADPDGVEGPAGRVEGLGLLNVQSVLAKEKVTRVSRGVHRASRLPVEGYEIHVGRTNGPDTARPWLDLFDPTGQTGRPDGATSADGMVAGCYVHGVLAADEFRAAFLADFGVTSTLRYDQAIDDALDAWADHLERYVAIDDLEQIARSRT